MYQSIIIEESVNGYRLTIYDNRLEQSKQYHKEDFETLASLQLFVLRWLQAEMKKNLDAHKYI